MDRRTDGWTDRWMDGWMDGRMDGQMDEQLCGRIDNPEDDQLGESAGPDRRITRLPPILQPSDLFPF